MERRSAVIHTHTYNCTGTPVGTTILQKMKTRLGSRLSCCPFLDSRLIWVSYIKSGFVNENRRRLNTNDKIEQGGRIISDFGGGSDSNHTNLALVRRLDRLVTVLRGLFPLTDGSGYQSKNILTLLK
jgi:hypothetical protein